MSTPERMCVVCRKMQPKQSLLRVVKAKDGQISFDETGKMSGRGAYICKSRECFDKLFKTKGFERSFKSSVPEDVFKAVNEKIGE